MCERVYVCESATGCKWVNMRVSEYVYLKISVLACVYSCVCECERRGI